ncbi:MAG: hypothetical protein KH135_00660 [Firmicutes bacterium]|nr:hypothetical protein [Bacillota bacterium]
MIVKVIKHFGDKETGATYAEQIKREVGDIFECNDSLAQERIEKGFVVEATDEEVKKYTDSIDTIENEDPNNGKLDSEDNDNDDEKGDNELSLLEELPYNELQKKAKDLGLKFVGVSKENLIKSIKEYEKQQEEMKKD